MRNRHFFIHSWSLKRRPQNHFSICRNQTQYQCSEYQWLYETKLMWNMVSITNVGKVPILDQKQQWNSFQIRYSNTCSLSVFRVIKVRLGPQVPQDLQEHLVPEGLQETQAEMGRRATQESRWDTCSLSQSCASVLCLYLYWAHSFYSCCDSYVSHCAEDPIQKTRCSFSLSWTLCSVLGSDILHLLLHMCSWQMLPYHSDLVLKIHRLFKTGSCRIHFRWNVCYVFKVTKVYWQGF